MAKRHPGVIVLALIVTALLALAHFTRASVQASPGGGVVTSQTAGYTNAMSAESAMEHDSAL